MDRPLCVKCGHEVREHQPAYGIQQKGVDHLLMGCMQCNCLLTLNEKLRAWEGGARK